MPRGIMNWYWGEAPALLCQQVCVREGLGSLGENQIKQARATPWAKLWLPCKIDCDDGDPLFTPIPATLEPRMYACLLSIVYNDLQRKKPCTYSHMHVHIMYDRPPAYGVRGGRR